MSKTRILIATAALTVASVPALAAGDGFQYVGGETGWTLAPYRPQAAANATAPLAATPSAFRYIPGETGWQPAPHALEIVGGKLVHSADCDHEIHAAPAVSVADLNSAARMYPGG